MYVTISSKPFPKRHILDSSKLKEFADHNFNFYENGRKFSEPVENSVEKGAFSPFSTVFSKEFYCRHVKTRACLGKGSMSSIMDQIRPELFEVSALELKIAIFVFVCTLAFSNTDQSTQNLVKIYIIIRPRITLIMGSIRPEDPDYYLTLNEEKLLNSFLFTLKHLQILIKQLQTWSKCMRP